MEGYKFGDLSKAFVGFVAKTVCDEDKLLFPVDQFKTETKSYRFLDDLKDDGGCYGCAFPPAVVHNLFNTSDVYPYICVDPEGLTPDELLAVIHFHGNCYDIKGTISEAKQIANATGAYVFAPEYPGFGVAPGKSSEHTVNQVADAMFDHVRSTLPNAKIIISGLSIGAGPAVRL
mmetsp:Transcript_23789/g.45705  ORF Transcript_23789/g.45705 Transcript_23789/m.45705 type:complete len:175 (+) Transcript_23789:67-591(+)